MRSAGFFASIALLLTYLPAAGAEPPIATITDPFIEMHTGPGRGYPIFHVVDRGEAVALLKRRTEWFKVRTADEREGWVHLRQLLSTLGRDGEPTVIEEADYATFSKRRWESGVMGGDFDGANLISVYGAVALTPHLSAELTISQGLGSFSDSVLGNVNLVHQFFPEWRFSPFFSLGTGMIRTSPKATLVETEDRTDQTASVGLGVRAYLTRRFLIRAEYKSHVVFTSRDENEESEEWKAGFSFFY